MEHQNKELNEILKKIKLEYKQEIERKKEEILRAQDRIHLRNADLMKLDHINDYKDDVRDMIYNYFSNHYRNFQEGLVIYYEKAISQLDD